MGVLGLFGVVINQICFFEGLSRTTPTPAAVINTIIPVSTLFFSIALGHEALNRGRLLGIALSVSGILVMLDIEKQHWESSLFWGDLLNLINSVSFSFYLVVSKKLNRRLHPMVVTTGMFLWGTLGAGIYGLGSAYNTTWLNFSPLVYVSMAFVVLGATIGTYSLNNWALGKTESSMVALYIYIQPILAGILSRLIYHEQLTTRVVLASLLVFAGVGVGSFLGKRKAEKVYVKV